MLNFYINLRQSDKIKIKKIHTHTHKRQSKEENFNVVLGKQIFCDSLLKHGIN